MGRAIAAGLSTYGKLAGEEKIRKEEAARQAKIDAREERRLSLQEQESKLRQEKLRRENMMKEVAWKNQQMVQAMTQGKLMPEAVGKAVTQYGSLGEVYEYNAEKSRILQEKDPKAHAGAVVYDVKKNRKGSDGKVQFGSDGKVVTDSFPEGSNELVLPNTTEYQRWAAQQGNPEHMFATMVSGMTDETLFKAAQERAKVKAQAEAETPQGKAALGLTAAKTELTKAQTAAVGQPKPGKEKTEIQLLGGGTKKMSHIETQNLGKAFDKMSKNIPSVTSPEEAARVNETKDNPKIREMFANDIALVVADPTQLKNIRDEWVAQGLNGEYFDQQIEEAQLNAEEWAEAEESRRPGLIKRAWNKIFN
jgi:hypothetical protein